MCSFFRSKCHFYLFFSKRNILFSKNVPFKEKLRHIVAPWMFLTSAFCIPIFLLAPVIAVIFGIFPAKSCPQLLFGFGAFYGLVLLSFALGMNHKHVLDIQLANGYDIVLWGPSFLSAIEILTTKICYLCCFCCCKENSPSPTKKQSTSQRSYEQSPSKSQESISRTQWIPILLGIVLSISAVVTGVVMVTSNQKVLPVPSDIRESQTVYVIWAAYNTLTLAFYAYYLRREQRKSEKHMLLGLIAPVLFIACMVAVGLRFPTNSYDFGEVLSKSLLFYEAQRSGELPPDNRIPWRGDSALGDVTLDGKSLTGGYYDAGDFVKFGLPLGETLTLLSWSILEFSDNYRAVGELENARSAVKWGTDYLLKCHTKKNEFYAQVGWPKEEHQQWGRPEDLFKDVKRVGQPLNKTHPGSDIAGASAAALAAAHLVFKEVDESYSKELLQNAIDLYAFGREHEGFAKNNLLEARFYDSQEFLDDLAMGAIWLYKSTGNKAYVEQSMKYLERMIDSADGVLSEYFGWDNQGAGVAVLLAVETKNKKYMEYVHSHFKKWVYTLKYTKQGFSFLTEWGALRFDANTAFLALVHAKHVLKNRIPGFRNMGEPVYHCWALAQIRRMLGDSGRSFVAGYGHNPPQYLHHRASSCPDRPAPCGWDDYNSPLPNPQILYGALVGGPFQNGSYTDARFNYEQNEPTIDYNAGFTASLSGLVSLSHGTPMCHKGAGFLQWIKRDRKFW